MGKGDPEKGKFLGCGCLGWILALIVFVLLIGVGLGPIGPGIRYPHESGAVQTARALDLALFEYANDNDGNYPDGATSTEVFQKLIDSGYIADMSYFYIPLPDKIAPVAGQKKIKPENVCWDITGGADKSSPDGLPLVFVTGYKIIYAPGGTAVQLPKPHRGWFGWTETQYFEKAGIAVGYKDNTAKFIPDPNGGGSVPNFIPLEFKADGKTYRQLTPDGMLP